MKTKTQDKNINVGVNTSITLLMMTHQKVNDQLRRIKAIDYIQVKQEKFSAGYRPNLYLVSIGRNTEKINSITTQDSHNSADSP